MARSRCDPGYWKDPVVFLLSTVAILGSLLWIHHAITADSPKSQLEMDCIAVTNINKLIGEVADFDNSNVEQYIAKNIESEAVKNAWADNNLEEIKKICAGPFERPNSSAHVIGAFFVMALGVIGCICFGWRFQHEYETYDAPTQV